MNIRLSREVNTNQGNRVEYWFNNFDFVDGGAYIAGILKQDYGMRVTEEIDGIWYTITRMRDDACEYNLVWHEDIGNYIYSTQQDEQTLQELETRVHAVAEKLNQRFQGIPGTNESWVEYIHKRMREDKANTIEGKKPNG